MRIARRPALACLAICAMAVAVPGSAGTADASFQVHVTLQPGPSTTIGVTGTAGAPGPSGPPPQGAVCTSQTQADANTALVQVVCTVDEFVEISPGWDPLETRRTRGPYRQSLAPTLPPTAVLGAGPGFDPRRITGTLTSMQVIQEAGSRAVLEMRVSF